MEIEHFHASRRFAEVASGRIAYVEEGDGPPALFVGGVPLNGYHWRHVMERLRHRRRCIAIDLMGLGYTEIAPGHPVSFRAQARMIAEVLDALGLEKIDLVANDSGGAIAQIFAAAHPERLRSLVLTNCDVDEGWPPPQVLPAIELAREGALAPIFQAMAERPDLARERHARGEPVPLFRCYADPGVLTDEVIRLYLERPLASPQRIDAFHRYFMGFDNAETIAIRPALASLQVPTLIVWGLDDIFFDVKWAYWLKNTIPGARRVIEVPDARLFFAEDRPDALAAPVLKFWGELS
ncbi:MAG TPA: alpha/beta hydrolase [Stellaceae bacterium]|nr:alpha/beta hydrolase [Stellaceae bacterium]